MQESQAFHDESILKKPGLLALAIVQAADDRIPIREYIKELQAHLKRKTSKHAGCTASCIDAASYWKQKFAESEAIQVDLRNRVHELEVKSRTLMPRDSYSVPDSSQMSSSLDVVIEGEVQDPIDKSKRKRPRSRGVKDLSINCSPLDMPQEELEIFMSLPSPSSLLRLLYDVRRSVRQRNPNIIAFSNTLVSLILAIQELVQTISESTTMRQYLPLEKSKVSNSAASQTTSVHTDMLCLVLSRTLAYLNRGLEKLCKTDHEYQAIGRMKYQLIRLFDNILNQIEDIAIRKSVAQNAASQQQDTDDRIQIQNRASRACLADLDIQAALCRVLLGMIKSIKLDLVARNDILEGYFHIFLSHLGVTVDTAMFQESQQSHQGLYRSNDSEILKRQEQKRSALPNLAPYIAWLIRQIAPELHAFKCHPSMTPSPVSGSMAETNSTVTRNSYRQVNRRIQTTLLQAIFADDKESFLDTLKSTPGGVDLAITRPLDLVFSNDSTDLFSSCLDELWRLIGWETLGLQDHEADDSMDT